MPLQEIFDRTLGHIANQLADVLPSLEQKNRRNTANAKLAGNIRIAIDIDLAHLDLSRLFMGDLLDRRPEGPIRTLPCRPKIDKDRERSFKHLLVEVGITHFDHIASHRFSSHPEKRVPLVDEAT